MKSFTIIFGLTALIASTMAAPQSYPGCQAATDAAKIGDTTALNNAIAACAAAAKQPGAGAAQPAPVEGDSSGGSIGGSSGGSGGEPIYDCGPASQYYKPGPHCENTIYYNPSGVKE